jgi:hypothetical protein
MGVGTPVSTGKNRSLTGNTIFGASDDLFHYEPVSWFEPNKFGAPTGVGRRLPMGVGTPVPIGKSRSILYQIEIMAE